jgi:hypothetical protein
MTRKRYTIIVEDDMVVGVEVNGQKYDAAIFIPDNIDQQRVEKMGEAATEIFPDEDFETRTTSSLGKIVVSVFLAVALIMLAIAVISGVNTGKATAREQSAPGRITSFSVQADSEGTRIYYPVVAFTLPDQSINTVQLDVGSSPPSYEVGQQVTVLYDPANPNQARIKSFGGALGVWALTLITGVMGLIFLGATGFAYWMVRPAKGKSARKPK